MVTLREVGLAAGEAATLATRIALAQRATRAHHPGPRAAGAPVNGAVLARAGAEVRGRPGRGAPPARRPRYHAAPARRIPRRDSHGRPRAGLIASAEVVDSRRARES